MLLKRRDNWVKKRVQTEQAQVYRQKLAVERERKYIEDSITNTSESGTSVNERKISDEEDRDRKKTLSPPIPARQNRKPGEIEVYSSINT